MISFPPENTGSRKDWIAVFVILMNMESVPFFFIPETGSIAPLLL